MRRVAAIDCGTNSLRLLIADVDAAAGTLTDVQRRLEVVRLGQGVDATGTIDPAAMARALAVTGEYARCCRQAGVQRLRFVATSASRDASNAAQFVTGVRDLLGVEPEVINGETEALLSFVGATRGLPRVLPSPYLVVDLGGGSTEFVLGDLVAGAATLETSCSVDVGSVRISERYLRSDPPTPAEVAAAVDDVTAAIDAAGAVVRFDRAATLIGVAGTVTTVTAHALRLPCYDSARVHGAVLPVSTVRSACAELLGATRQRRAGLPYLHPGRVDVIGAGALIWDLVIRRVDVVGGVRDVVTSEHDLLDGIAWSLAS